MKVVVRRAAQKDIELAGRYYAKIDPDLEQAFEQALDAAIGHVVEQPHAHAMVHRDIRRVRLRKFPHALYYRLLQGHIVVVACLHPRRNPVIWMGRL